MVVRAKRRVPYEKLRERLWESALPFDCEAERLAIGAVLLAPNDWARKFSVKLYSGHFYDRGHGWLWEELATAMQRKWRLDRDLDAWLSEAKIVRRFKEQFGAHVVHVVAPCIDDCWWYWGRWYIDRVLVAAKLRSGVMNAAHQFSEALGRAEEWKP